MSAPVHRVAAQLLVMTSSLKVYASEHRVHRYNFRGSAGKAGPKGAGPSM